MGDQIQVSVTEEGALIPKRLLEGIELVEIRKENGLIVVVPVPPRDPVFNIGAQPVDDEVTDASARHDHYIYHFRQAGFSVEPAGR